MERGVPTTQEGGIGLWRDAVLSMPCMFYFQVCRASHLGPAPSRPGMLAKAGAGRYHAATHHPVRERPPPTGGAEGANPPGIAQAPRSGRFSRVLWRVSAPRRATDEAETATSPNFQVQGQSQGGSCRLKRIYRTACSKKPRCTPNTPASAPAWSISPAGKCRSSTSPSSMSIMPCACRPACSTLPICRPSTCRGLASAISCAACWPTTSPG